MNRAWGRQWQDLLIGYGNRASRRRLGPALAEAVAAMNLPDVTVDADYQLTFEDAAHVAEHDAVIFADATVAGDEPISFARSSRAAVELTSHDCDPQAVLALAHDLFGARTAVTCGDSRI